MMNLPEMYLWAKMHSYPQLVLAHDLRIWHGERPWLRFLSNASDQQIAMAQARIEQWQCRERRTQESELQA
jgi:hypothetical protein